MKNFDVEINDYGYSGEGVGRTKGKVCFVPYALKGELCNVELVKENSGFCRAVLNKVITPSPLRIVPPCPYFAKCGGCTFQNLEYKDELEVKKYLILNQLKKLGFNKEIDVKASPKHYNYRNKIKLFCDGKSLALYQSASKKLVPIKQCLLVKEEINEAIGIIQTFINAKQIESAIDNVYIRVQGNKRLVWFKFNKRIKIDFSGLQIMLGANSGVYTSYKDGKLEHVSGVEKLSAKEFELDCEFNVNDFHQVNDEISEELYKEVFQNISGQKVINAYSGAGVLSGIIARSGKTVFGIELGRSEHESAQKLKEKNNLTKLYNIHGDCGVLLKDLIPSDLQTLVIDPPRAGVSESVCKAINSSNINKLIYVSCESSTFVRDAMRLSNYKLTQVKIFDMFPQTSSIELLCILEKSLEKDKN